MNRTYKQVSSKISDSPTRYRERYEIYFTSALQPFSFYWYYFIARLLNLSLLKIGKNLIE